MAYTLSRLALAKRLFLKPKTPTAPSSTPQHQYSLRKRSAQPPLTSFLDEDDTDDYDPKVERALLRRKRICKPPKGSVSRSLIVKLQMASEDAKGFLASFPLSQDDDDQNEMTTGMDFDGDAPPIPIPTPTYPLLRTITTSLPHPIDPFYLPPEDGTLPCHFCSSPSYGILGLGPRCIEILDYGNGHWLEIGGAEANAHAPSRMCVTCALERVHIVECKRHHIVPLKGWRVEGFDFEAAYRSLPNNPWCSLCPNPAFFGCAARQTGNVYLEPVDGEVGCGLLLCESCEVWMRVLKGDLKAVVDRNQIEDPLDGCRADVEFLMPGNWLWGRIRFRQVSGLSH
ncbi:hypothetical protein BO70DRAFT_389544 [Aspergillus heteromorphus CBS 117.55]|uniref:C6 finger domain protein n=1 Tax=Aspergillus heteromorphus CBS 117.55 TaxID=1448321 RepID=A0A317VFM0_9EURO|nr:uncharacterized protein BO70DRAFT_389544 [Aspergillus heteromorphus CBS 117.55]PWY71682.1 hypothetical protein BO70DRAFT_389544 [Aspergillus heteromorphus CBS 117.55]